MPLDNVDGANYHPSWSWNAYQTWANYNADQMERELDYAAKLGLNSLRTNLSYEFWRDEQQDNQTANRHLGTLEHFLTQCDQRGIQPLLMLFEAPPQGDPANVNPLEYRYGIHSPSRSEVLQPRNWSGYSGSPEHFVTRLAGKLSGDDRVLAVEIMNEPGDIQPRADFVVDMATAFRENAPNVPVTVGTKDTEFARYYDEDRGLNLDAWQFHMNLPKDPASASAYIMENAGRTSKPVWCTEWQRTREEGGPAVGLPFLRSLAPTVNQAREQGTLQGDYFWGLMFKPAYLSRPRQGVGRTNGVFHPDGRVFSDEDARAVSHNATSFTEYTRYPDSWREYPSFSAFPDPSQLPGASVSGEPLGVGGLVLAGGALAYILSRPEQ